MRDDFLPIEMAVGVAGKGLHRKTTKVSSQRCREDFYLPSRFLNATGIRMSGQRPQILTDGWCREASTRHIEPEGISQIDRVLGTLTTTASNSNVVKALNTFQQRGWGN